MLQLNKHDSEKVKEMQLLRNKLDNATIYQLDNIKGSFHS